VDYRTQRFEDEVRDADAVLDLVGGDMQVVAAFFLVEVTTERLDKIADLIDRGELKTHIGAVLPLADARDAHMMLDGRRSQPTGKIILRV
jgi:NADPH:quinone reductase-like Zn-dependent oxidoreductase